MVQEVLGERPGRRVPEGMRGPIKPPLQSLGSCVDTKSVEVPHVSRLNDINGGELKRVQLKIYGLR